MASSAGTMPNTGQWGWYKDHEGRQFRRVSKLIDKVDTDTFMLDKWKKRTPMIGAAYRDDIILGIKALGAQPATGWTAQQKKQFDAWAQECITAAGGDAGRIRGTAVHDLTERVDRGEPIDQVCAGLPGDIAGDLRAYAKLRELNGWKSVEIERTVVCDELDVAGSFDRIDVVPGLARLLGPGHCQHGHAGHYDADGDVELPVIVDVKTEGDPLKNGLHIAPQLAIYSRAKRMWLPGEAYESSNQPGPATYVDAPCVRQDVGVIVHVRNGKAVPYFVDLTAGWEAAQAAAAQLKREQAAKKWFAAVPGIVEPKPAEVLVENAAARKVGHLDAVMTPEAGASYGKNALATALLDASKALATTLGPAPMPIVTETPSGTVTTHGTVEQVAVTRPDGLVDWVGVAPDPSTQVISDALDAIAAATTVEHLAKTYEIWTGQLGLAWVGAVAEAGEKRRKVIECPQAALHTGSGKCACGWVA